jgi:hypothetical protein
MNKEFIPYEQALEIKQLGFDEKCLAYYNIDPIFSKPFILIEESFDYKWCLPAPLYQQVFRWFRDKYELIFHIECDYNPFLGYKDGYIPIYSLYPYSHDCYKTYEEAELACLRELIKIVKNK